MAKVGGILSPLSFSQNPHHTNRYRNDEQDGEGPMSDVRDGVEPDVRLRHSEETENSQNQPYQHSSHQLQEKEIDEKYDDFVVGSVESHICVV